MQSSIHASLKWQDGVTPVSKWTGLCVFSLYLEFPALQWMPVLLLTHVSTSTLLCACLWNEHPYNFVYLGLQVKWNLFSSNNSHHTSCIHKGSHAGKWPDLIRSKLNTKCGRSTRFGRPSRSGDTGCWLLHRKWHSSLYNLLKKLYSPDIVRCFHQPWNFEHSLDIGNYVATR